MTKAASKRVAESQARAAEAGAERLTLTVYGDDAARWREWLARFAGVRGAKMAAFRAAISAGLDQGEPSDEELTAEVLRRLKAKRP